MTTTVSISIPVHSIFVPRCLDNILDKKVQRIALSWLETFVHFFCSYFLFGYHSLYKSKRARVHYFSDGIVPLYDLTKRGLSSIMTQKTRHLITNAVRESDWITLDGRRLFFHQNQEVELLFSRRFFTDFVVVKDVNEGDSLIEIEQTQIVSPRNPLPVKNRWRIDLSVVEVLRVQLGLFLVNQEEIYMGMQL